MNCFRAFINMRYYIWTGLWAAVVLVLCLLPPSEFKSAGFFFIGADKLVHTGMFFVFSILLFNAEIRRTKSPGFQFSLFFSVVAIAIFFALLTEFLQWKFFTYRSAEWWDLFANFIGIGMAGFAYLTLHFFPRKKG